MCVIKTEALTAMYCMWQAPSHEAGEQPGQQVDRLRNLSKRLDAAAGHDADEVEDQIRSHPDVQVTACLSGFGVCAGIMAGGGGGGHREDAFLTRLQCVQ